MAAKVKHLPPDSALARAELGDAWDWGHMAANMAELVDLMSYWLTSEYAKWTHDPDDPATKRARAMEKRRGKPKPPPVPLIPPVAHRPPSIAEKYQRSYQDLTARFASMPDKVVEQVTSDEFDRALGL